MTQNNIAFPPTPQNFVQGVLSQTKKHSELWELVNVIFLGFPALCEKIGEAWGRGRTKHEVTLLEPISLGTDVEKQVNVEDTRVTLEQFLNHKNPDGKTRLEAFFNEIKKRFDDNIDNKNLPEICGNVLWAVRKDVDNCRVQLAALAKECPQRDEARMRLQLALLRREGVEIAISAVNQEIEAIRQEDTSGESQKLRQFVVDKRPFPLNENEASGGPSPELMEAMRGLQAAAQQVPVDWTKRKADTTQVLDKFRESKVTKIKTRFTDELEEKARGWTLEKADKKTQTLANRYLA
jgi:hypothetical protein